ncbi:class I SAM-dependent methyltransferase [Nonomuraea sp. ZG12]|uniref:class I SAM-dependent methyltransferase n=1 Tax=Nonomuraea sp. ZG12 TaxID=3452207 RepID=UPI003F88D1E7
MWPSELDLMARIAGMRLHERFAGWDKGAFTAATGQLLRRLATYGPANSATHWIGVDREPAMAEVAQHCADLGNVEVIEGDLHELRHTPEIPGFRGFCRH